ncbi:MAG: efflux transporter outer membrane subunit [Gammaproteobacteria bacterium]|nr:efflux transporter outer membrane subunit [Gammaproteobacteria bacterium]
MSLRARPGRTAPWRLTACCLGYLGAVLLAGCVRSTGIDHQLSPLTLAMVETDKTFNAWPSSEWWREYHAPALDELIEHGLRDAPSLQVALARLRAARAGTEFVGARLTPHVDAGFETTLQRYSENGLAPPSIAGDRRTDNRYALDLAYELDLFGRRRAEVAAAQARTLAIEIDSQTVRLGVASAIARAYFYLAQACAERTVVKDTLTQRQRILSLVQVRVAEGLDSNVELRQAEGAIPQGEGELVEVDERIALLRSALAKLAVVPLAATANLSPALSARSPPTLPAIVPSSLLARRPDIAAARNRVDSVLHGVEAVRAEFYPTVNLAAFVGFSALGLGALLEGGSLIYGAAPAVSLPIFDAGRLRAKLKFVNAQTDELIAQYNQVLLDALQEVVHAVISIRALALRDRTQRAAQDSAESAYALALQRFRAGLTGYLTVLATETEVLRQRRAATTLAARAYTLDIDLKRALGGGFEAAVPAATP